MSGFALHYIILPPLLFSIEKYEHLYHTLEGLCIRIRSLEEGLRVSKRYNKEHIINSVACGGDTWDVNRRRLKTKVLVTRLNTRGYIIRDSMTLQKSIPVLNLM